MRTSAGQANAILIAYDLLEVDGQDIRREPLQDRRKRLERLLREPKQKAAQTVGSGLVLSEAIIGKGGSHVPGSLPHGLRRDREQAARFGLREHAHAQLVEDQEPEFERRYDFFRCKIGDHLSRSCAIFRWPWRLGSVLFAQSFRSGLSPPLP